MGRKEGDKVTKVEQEILEKVKEGLLQLVKDGTIVKLNSDCCGVTIRINLPENAVETMAKEVMAQYTDKPNV